MKAEPLSFGISPEARTKLDSEVPGTGYAPLIRPSATPTVDVDWVHLSSDERALRLLQNDLGEELALDRSVSISSLRDHVLHHTGKEFVLLSDPRSTPRTRYASTSPVTAGKVKSLREQTGRPMMDCKRALEASNGDLDAARRLLSGSHKPSDGSDGWNSS